MNSIGSIPMVNSFNISKIPTELDSLNINWNPRDGIHTILSYLNFTNLLEVRPDKNQPEILSHGCWCSHIGNDKKRGREPNDELDEICKKWLQARRCSRLHENMCDNEVDEDGKMYQLKSWRDDCDSEILSSCQKSMCEIDKFYFVKIASHKSVLKIVYKN